MLTLHVTRDLAKVLKLQGSTTKLPSAAASALGPWSLDIVHCRPAKLVVAISATTRWSFALHAAPLATLQQRFGPALLLNLLAIGVPPDRARAEVDAHTPTQWALGHHRGVLTHLNQSTYKTVRGAEDGMSLPSINRRLADNIILKPKVAVASDEVLRALGGNPDLQASSRRALGQVFNETYELMQAQAGKDVVVMPVLRLVGEERLEAGYQAEQLLHRLPVSSDRTLASGRAPRWVPSELVLDLEGIEAIGVAFATTFYNEAAKLGLTRLRLRNAPDDVVEQMLRGQK